MYKCSKCEQTIDYLPKIKEEYQVYYDVSHHGCGGTFEEAEECILCGKVTYQSKIIKEAFSTHICPNCLNEAMSDNDTAVNAAIWMLQEYPNAMVTYFKPDLMPGGELAYFAALYLLYKEFKNENTKR